MYVSEVNITPIKPTEGLIAFASVVVDGSLYLGSIAVYTRPDGTYRLLYPTKKVGEKLVNLFHPISREASKNIEYVIFKKCNEIFNNNHEDTLSFFE